MKTRDSQDILRHFYALFVGLVLFWAYVKTLAPTVSFFDSGELIAAAYTLGVAHPPGYPLYVLLGWLFSRLPVGNVAWRLNLMSAFFATFASLMVYYITYGIIAQSRRDRAGSLPSSPISNPQPANNHSQQQRKARPDPERMLHPVAAMIAALTFGFSMTHWQHALIAEVYTLNAFLAGLIMLLLFTWRSYNVERSSSGMFSPLRSPLQHSCLLYLAALIFGLGFGNHQTLSLLCFAACFLVLMTAPRVMRHIKTLLLIVVFLAFGLSIYLLVPLRAAQNPPINWGNASTWRQFKWLILREGYKNVSRGYALKSLWDELAGKDETPADTPPEEDQNPVVSGENTGLARIYHVIAQSLFLKQLKSFNLLQEFGYLGTFLAALGLLYGLCVYRVETLAMLLAVASLVIIITIIGDAPEENIFLVGEFHTPSYLLVAVWIGMGTMALARAILCLAYTYRNLQYALVVVLAVYFLFALSGERMLNNLRAVNRQRNYVAYDYANNVLKSLQPKAILFTWGDSGAFPLWYLQIVENVRADVILIHVPHLSADWYVESLPQDLFVSEDAHHKYSGDIRPIIEEIVQKNLPTRPLYFDFSSVHSLMLPFPLLPNGVTYKVAVTGDRIDESVWKRYSFRGILEDTPIARDPDIDRTYIMYGSAHVELGHYYMQFEEVQKAAEHFNIAVQFEPSLGDRIVRELRFQDKLAPESPAHNPELYGPRIPRQPPSN